MTTQIQNAAVNVQIAKQAVSDLQKLQKQFKSADALLARANKAVYSVLSCAFDVLVELKTADENKRVLKLFDEQLAQMTRSSKAKHATAATSLELKVVRFVCGNLQPKRENSYARVLRVAFAENLHANDAMSFVDWVIGAGGIDNIRRSGAGSAPTDYAQLARETFKAKEGLSRVAPQHINDADGMSVADVEFCVAIVRKNDDGSFEIVTTVDNASLTNQALKRAGKTLEAQNQVVNAAEEQRKRAAAAHSATNEALQQSVDADVKEAA
ncbi:hypothetical protein Q4494_04280 [Celeribacter halophilus]|jgi:hypothetical protein|uniref:Uncharacterized protein n=1 Tax=Celeribacter halophilus TaxID=576117 RepID=A0AAW7XU71_9RHOB|nr:hypothetical protein [Celeribacter halophilus]MDO6456285.1 hypothetical protein [Celeribacter halophilus]